MSQPKAPTLSGRVCNNEKIRSELTGFELPPSSCVEVKPRPTGNAAKSPVGSLNKVPSRSLYRKGSASNCSSWTGMDVLLHPMSPDELQEEEEKSPMSRSDTAVAQLEAKDSDAELGPAQLAFKSFNKANDFDMYF